MARSNSCQHTWGREAREGTHGDGKLGEMRTIVFIFIRRQDGVHGLALLRPSRLFCLYSFEEAKSRLTTVEGESIYSMSLFDI